MNKKLRILLIGAILLLVLAIAGYFIILPMFADDSDVVDSPGIEDNSIPVDGIDLTADDLNNSDEDGFEIDSNVGESDILPLEDDSDPTLNEDDMAVDFDLLTDDQRSRILAGELTMDELKAEMKDNQAVSGNEDSTTSLTDTAITTTSEQDKTVQNTEDDVNYGEPGVQVDMTIPTLSAIDNSVKTTTTNTPSQEKIEDKEEVEEAPQKDVVKVSQDVELDTTYDSANLHRGWFLISFLLVLVIRFAFYRRSRL